METNPRAGFKAIHELEKVFGFTIPKDGIMMALKKQVMVDVFELDKAFSSHDHEYDQHNALYKGKACSMEEYVKQKFGEDAATKLKTLI